MPAVFGMSDFILWPLILGNYNWLILLIRKDFDRDQGEITWSGQPCQNGLIPSSLKALKDYVNNVIVFSKSTREELDDQAEVKYISHRYNEKHKFKLQKTFQRSVPLPVYILTANSVTAKWCAIKDVSVPDTTWGMWTHSLLK